MMVEIIHEYHCTNAGFHAGMLTPKCRRIFSRAGLQGGPRSPGRFYDMLIRAKKLVNKGTLAEIEGGDGVN